MRRRAHIDGGAASAIADVVIWSGDPFELSSRAEAVFVAGKPQSLETRQTRLFRRYRKLPRRARSGGGGGKKARAAR